MTTRDARWENVYASVRNNTNVEFLIEVRHNKRYGCKIYVLRKYLDNPDFDGLYQKILEDMIKNLDDFMEGK